MAKWLTKSDYAKFLIHPAYFWISKYAKGALPAFGEIAQAKFEEGNVVDAVAQQLFPDGHRIDVPMFDGPDESASRMQVGGPASVFQPSALTSRRLYARSDIMVRHGETWDIYEVKNSASVKTAHLLDLAFQKYVWEEAGHTIGKSFVVHVNAQYVRDGPVNPADFFTIVEVTDQIEPLAKSTADKIAEAILVLNQTQQPDDAPDLAGEWYGYREVYRYLHPDLPAASILNLTRLNLEQLQRFTARGITEITAIPDNFEVLPQQQTQIAVARSTQPLIAYEKIKKSLGTLQYPLYFLDYETFASAVPLWDGVRPYQQLPFQYSLHVIREQNGPLLHREFLGRGTKYPVAKLLERLQTDLGNAGNVVVWNKSFEMGCNDAMANLHPEYYDFLSGVNSRVYDLMEIFASGWYAHTRFMGSASIKKVLPVLVPELSYNGLGIGEGLTAQIRWVRSARGELTSDQMQQVYDDLIEYCGQDTLAMVKIYEVLQHLEH